MGSASTKESRGASPPPHHHRSTRSFSAAAPVAFPQDVEQRSGTSSLRLGRRHRGENFEAAALLGISLSHHRGGERAEREEGPHKTREERRAEKEAERRKEREKERERSMAEESIDGGYLVTVGVYTGPEDYSLKIVRQLQIERRLAPFWKGIADHEDDWTDSQLVAAAQGLEIPDADADAALPPSPIKPNATSEDLNRLTVPMATRSRSQSYGSDASPSSSTGRLSSLSLSSSPLAGFTRPRSKTLGFSRSSSSNNAAPVETNIPSRTVNNRPIEAVLYENASECPICFLYYPPHLNRTRCCDQPICSECFVQIKRADPHVPEHSPPGSPTPQPADQDRRAHAGDQLVSEPASCPFCKQPEFGVVFTPLPWKRGIVYANQTHPYSVQQQSPLSYNSEVSSTSSLPTTPSSPRKKVAYAVNAPEVITTDRIRPDWVTKLAHAKNQAARRAAAATALHTAAYLVHNMNTNTGTSSNPFSSRRILRRIGSSSGSATPNGGGSGTATPAPAASATSIVQQPHEAPADNSTNPVAPNAPSALHNVLRRARMVDLEEMMLMEAIRLSLAEEEERKKKEEKEAKAKRERGGGDQIVTRLATSAPEPSSMSKGKGPAPRVDTSVQRTSEEQSPTVGFGAAQHLKIHRATSDVSSSASSMKEPEATGNSDDEDSTEPMFNFQSLAQTLMATEDETCGKGKQVEHVDNGKEGCAGQAVEGEPDTADARGGAGPAASVRIEQETA